MVTTNAISETDESLSSGASLPSPEELKMRDVDEELTVYGDDLSSDDEEEWEDLTVYDDGEEEDDEL